MAQGPAQELGGPSIFAAATDWLAPASPSAQPEGAVPDAAYSPLTPA